MLLDTLWIYLNPKPMNALHSEAQYMCTSIRHWVVERPDSMVVGNDVRFKRVNLTQDTYYLWSVDHIKTTNLSTYTPIENCYTPLTGSKNQKVLGRVLTNTQIGSKQKVSIKEKCSHFQIRKSYLQIIILFFKKAR